MTIQCLIQADDAEAAAVRKHSILGRAVVAKSCAVADSNGNVFDFSTDSDELVYLDTPFQREFNEERIKELQTFFLENPNKDMMIGQVICMEKEAVPEEVLADLKKKKRLFKYGISGGQHSRKAIVRLAQAHGDREAFFKDHPKLRRFQVKVFAMGALAEYDRLFDLASKGDQATAFFDSGTKMRYFHEDSDPFVCWEKLKSKDKYTMALDKLTVDEKAHMPTVVDAMIELRMEHNEMGSSSDASWTQKLVGARTVWVESIKTRDPPEPTASEKEKVEHEQFLVRLKSQLNVTAGSSAMKYKNILDLSNDSWMLLEKILELDTSLALRDHSATKVGDNKFLKGKTAPVFNIQYMLNLCNLCTSPEKAKEVEDVLRNVASCMIPFASIPLQINLIKVNVLLKIYTHKLLRDFYQVKMQLMEASSIFVGVHVINMDKGEEVCKAIGAAYEINNKSRGWKTRMMEGLDWEDIMTYSVSASFVHQLAGDVLKEWRNIPKKVVFSASVSKTRVFLTLVFEGQYPVFFMTFRSNGRTSWGNMFKWAE